MLLIQKLFDHLSEVIESYVALKEGYNNVSISRKKDIAEIYNIFHVNEFQRNHPFQASPFAVVKQLREYVNNMSYFFNDLKPLVYEVVFDKVYDTENLQADSIWYVDNATRNLRRIQAQISLNILNKNTGNTTDIKLLSELTNKINSQDEKIKMLESQNKTIDSELNNIIEENERKQSLIDSLTDQLYRQKNYLDGLETKYNEICESYKTKFKEVENLTQDKEELQRKATRYELVISQLKNEIADLNSKLQVTKIPEKLDETNKSNRSFFGLFNV